MSKYWSIKDDQEDQDKNTFCPWTEKALKENMTIEPPKDNKG